MVAVCIEVAEYSTKTPCERKSSFRRSGVFLIVSTNFKQFRRSCFIDLRRIFSSHIEAGLMFNATSMRKSRLHTMLKTEAKLEWPA